MTSSTGTLPADAVLVIDQTRGDQSVHYGGMTDDDFQKMLTDAVERYPAEKVVVKVHPDVLAGKKQGYLTGLAKQLKIKLLAEDLTAEQLATCRCVYTGTSLMGLEALMRGVPVECFGKPFYAGWGLTGDRQAIPARVTKRSLEEVFLASYVIYPTYLDPVSGGQCDLEDILEHLALQFEQRERVGRRYTCVGITPWKKRYINRYLQSSDYTHRHIPLSGVASVDSADQKMLVWGKKAQSTDLEKNLSEHAVARMEDGFLRSVGLGSNFTAPRSLVIDDLGIYFDATQPSRLEHMLLPMMRAPTTVYTAITGCCW